MNTSAQCHLKVYDVLLTTPRSKIVTILQKYQSWTYFSYFSAFSFLICQLIGDYFRRSKRKLSAQVLPLQCPAYAHKIVFFKVCVFSFDLTWPRVDFRLKKGACTQYKVFMKTGNHFWVYILPFGEKISTYRAVYLILVNIVFLLNSSGSRYRQATHILLPLKYTNTKGIEYRRKKEQAKLKSCLWRMACGSTLGAIFLDRKYCRP